MMMMMMMMMMQKNNKRKRYRDMCTYMYSSCQGASNYENSAVLNRNFDLSVIDHVGQLLK